MIVLDDNQQQIEHAGSTIREIKHNLCHKKGYNYEDVHLHRISNNGLSVDPERDEITVTQTDRFRLFLMSNTSPREAISAPCVSDDEPYTNVEQTVDVPLGSFCTTPLHPESAYVFL